MAVVSRRAKGAGLVIAAVIVVGIAASVYLRSDAFLRHITPALERRVSGIVGAPVHIWDIHTVGDAEKQLSVEITEPDGSSPILSIDALRLTYRLAPLLRRTVHITDVRATGVNIHVRRMRDNTLNVDPVVAAVTAEDDGGVPIELFVGSIELRSVSIVADDVVGGLRIAIPDVTIVSDLSAPIPLSAERPFTAAANEWTVAQGANVQTLGAITAHGTVDADRIVVHDALLTALDSRVSASGTIAFTPTVDLTLDGVVDVNAVRQLYLDTLRDARGAVELDGLRVTGDLSDPVVEGPWGFRDALWGQVLVAAGSGAVRWRGGDAVFRDVELSVFGGSVVATAQADDLGTGVIEVEATVRDLDIARLREAFAPTTGALAAITGKLHGGFSATLSADDLLSKGEWRLTELAWDGAPIGDGRGSATHDVAGARFDAHVTLAGAARVALSGALPIDVLDAAVSFTIEDVGPLAAVLGQNARGAARGQGRVTGPTDSPAVEVQVEWPDGTWRDFPVRNASAELRWEADTLHILSARSESGDGAISASGVIRVSPDGVGPPMVDVAVEATRFLLDPYAAILSPGAPFSGAVSGEFRVAGDLDALGGEGTLGLSEATVGSTPIVMTSVGLSGDTGAWTVPAFEFTAGGIPFRAHANFDAQAYAFSVASIGATPITDALRWFVDDADTALSEVQGSVRLNVEAAGSYESPAGELHAVISDAAFGAARLGSSDFHVTYADGAIVGSGDLSDGAYAVAMHGKVEPGAIPFDATLTFADTDVLPLIRLVGQPAGKGLSRADVGGKIDIVGDLMKWREALASVDLSSLRLRTPNYELTNVDPVRGSISATGIDLSPVVMNGSDPAHPFEVEVSGLLDLHKPIAFDVEARAFDLAMLCDFMGVPGLAAGVGTYRLDIQGTTAEPIVTMSWSLSKATIALRDGAPRLEIEDVRGEAEYKDRIVTLTKMGMRLGGRDVDVTGEIPMELTFVLVPLVDQLLDAPLRLTVTTQQDDLSWLPSLHPALLEASGSASVTLDVEGTIRNPRVTGSARLDASHVALDFSNRSLENIVVAATFGVDADGNISADVTSHARVGAGTVRGSGAFTHPLDLVDWRHAFQPDSLRGYMDFAIDGLRLSRLVEFAGHGSPPLELEASGSARLDVVGVDPRRWQGSVKISDAALIGNGLVLPNQGAITASYDGSTIRLDRCRFGMGAQQLDVAGALYEDGRWEGQAEASALEVAILGSFMTGPAFPRGLLTATASVGGSPNAPTFDADWILDDLRYKRFRLDTFTGSAVYADGVLVLPEWSLESFGNHMTVGGNAPLAIAVGSDGLTIGRPDLPMSMTLKTEGFDISFASLLIPSVSEASGTALIDLSISGTSSRPHLIGRIEMPDAALTLAHNGMRLDHIVAYLDARRNRVDVDKFRFQVGPARYEMTNTSLDVDGLDPVLLRTSMTVTNGSVEAWFPTPADGESAVVTSVTGTVAAFVDVEALRREGLLTRAATGSELFERAVRLISHVQGEARLSSLSVGWLGYDLANAPDTPVKLSFEDGVLSLDQVELRQLQGDRPDRHAEVRASGTWSIGGELDVDVGGTLGAGFITDWMAEQVFTQPGQVAPPATGSFNYSVHVTGADTSPVAVMGMDSTDLALGKLRLESIAATATYADDVLTLDNCSVTASNSTATLRGSIPFTVSMYEAKAQPRDADMQMLLDAEFKNADILPLIFPFIGRAYGTGEAHVEIGGRLDDLRYYGSSAVVLNGLRLDLPANHLELSGVEVAIAALGDRLEIIRLDGVVNDSGPFEVIRGTVGLARGWPATVDIEAVADHVLLSKPNLYRVVGDASVRMHGPLERVQVDGSITLSSLNYKRDWVDVARESLTSKALIALREGARFQYPILRGMVVDLRVHADEEDVEFDTGAGILSGDIDGEVVGPLTELIFVGEARRLQGQFAYRGQRFDIESGYAENWDRTRFNPSYEITATSAETLRNVIVVDTQGNASTQDANVSISVSGALDDWAVPEIDVTVLNQAPGEDYAMTPAESMALLTWGDASRAASGINVGEAFYDELSDRFSRQMAPWLRLDDLTFDLDTVTPEDSRIQFTKELSRRVVLTYGSTFQLGQEQRLEMDYQIDRHIGISGERNEEGKYGVDLKLEYEFR